MISPNNIWQSPVDYDLYASLIQERNADLLANMAVPHIDDGGELLDIGCGTGAMLSSLCTRSSFGRVVAIDISGEMLGKARERVGTASAAVELVQGDFMTTTINGHFSMIASNAAIHWFAEQIQRVFERIVPLARSNGIIAIATAGACAEVEQFDEHVEQALPACKLNSFRRRRINEPRLRSIAADLSLDVLDSFLLLRSVSMPTRAYASWLIASGVMMDSRPDAPVEYLLERHFGKSLTLYHCSVFGLLRKPQQ